MAERLFVDFTPLNNWARIYLLGTTTGFRYSAPFALESRIRFDAFLRHIRTRQIEITPEMMTLNWPQSWRIMIIEAICMRHINAEE